jgi:four helix bundle protein
MSEKPQDLKPRTKAFAVRVIRMYSKLLKNDTIAQVLGKQVLRSGTSVGANYREASRGRSKAEFISKIGDCLKEIEETEYWLELLVTAIAFRQQRWLVCLTKHASSSPYSRPLTNVPKENFSVQHSAFSFFL